MCRQYRFGVHVLPSAISPIVKVGKIVFNVKIVIIVFGACLVGAKNSPIIPRCYVPFEASLIERVAARSAPDIDG